MAGVLSKWQFLNISLLLLAQGGNLLTQIGCCRFRHRDHVTIRFARSFGLSVVDGA